MTADRPLESRVAIVTGGSRGLGRGIAVGLAGAGASVVVASRDQAACQTVVDEIEAAGGSACAVPCDIALADDRTRLVDSTIEAFGRLDVLFNNAGLLKPHVTTKVTEQELDQLISVNLKGPVFLATAALDHLSADGGGSVVNVSALGAFQPMEGIGAYQATKAAMVNWTTTMAREWVALGVRVNLLVPGPIATDMILPKDPDRREVFVADMAAQTGFGRLGTPEDLVGAAVFLAGDASAFMTGRAVFIDGGMLG
ncbi:MAG: SDR family NAD(P)-dependent oxidoreductase [Acidimicrobiales bacterium]